MPNLNLTSVSLVDLARLTKGSGKDKTPIVDVLSKANDMLGDITFKTANKGANHQFSHITSRPQIHWTAAGQPTPASRSHASMMTEVCAQLEGVSLIEYKEANMGTNNVKEIRAHEDAQFIEAFGDTFADTLMYGNAAADPRQLNGFATRFGALGGITGDQMIDAGGVGADNTSMYLIGWGDNSVYGLVPEGMQAGLDHIDRGLTDRTDANGGEYMMYKSVYNWNVGLCVQDWRYVSRICNIDVSELSHDMSTGANLTKLAISAKNRIHKLEKCRPYWYVNRTIFEALEQQAQFGQNVRYGKDEMNKKAGGNVMHLCGIPVRRMDNILDTEAVVA